MLSSSICPTPNSCRPPAGMEAVSEAASIRSNASVAPRVRLKAWRTAEHQYKAADLPHAGVEGHGGQADAELVGVHGRSTRSTFSTCSTFSICSTCSTFSICSTRSTFSICSTCSTFSICSTCSTCFTRGGIFSGRGLRLLGLQSSAY
ncbi:hypothetical protein EYF80_055559 [Liparis tanakae]|uniref:Uncharacterized protein n=1 Tax=Liparis tanakae TaxID=230148 RepID=A0A4Z2EZH5_9TELE|nr:hypothetical protein EYF80_055559 [Liparis tanakae]